MDEDETLIDTGEDDARPGTDPRIKASMQELIKHGYLEEAHKPVLFRTAVTYEATINNALEPLDFSLRIDTHRGIALLVLLPPEESENDEWKHPMVRRQRLTLEQSILVALLREAFLLHEQEKGIGQATAKLAVEDLLPKFLTYLPDSGSDNRNQSRLNTILDQLKTHGIVSEIDKHNEITIRPLIVHLANADSLKSLLETFLTHAETE